MIACLALMLASAPADRVPVYPGAHNVEIGSGLKLAGAPAQLAYFVTADPPLAVARGFVSQWRAAGLPVVSAGDFEVEGVVSAFDLRARRQLAVIVVARRRGTLAFAVARSLDVATPPPALERPGSAFDPGSVREVAGSLAEVRASLRSEASKTGLQERVLSESDGAAVLEHWAPGASFITALVRTSDGQVAIWQVEGGER